MPKTKSKPAAETREVPSTAMRFSLGPCQFAAGDGETGNVPFSMLARSAEPVFNWYYGWIYHDFAGMKHRERIAVDYCHNDAEILGYADQFPVDDEGLHLAGAIVPFSEGDRASEVAHKQKAGVPYEASIDFTGDDVVYEEVREGYVAEVNGRQVAGPALIVREWPLRGVAICPHGMDARTETQFSQRDKKVRCKFLQATTMAKTSITGKKPASKLSTKAPKPAPASKMAEDSEEEKKPDGEQADDEDADEDAPADDETSEEEEEPETEQDEDEDEKEKPEQKQSAKGRSAMGKELAKFTSRFGVENGTKWFLAGKTIDQAMSLHAKDLERQMAAKDAEIEKLNKRLSQAKPGEKTPSTFTEDSKEAPPADGKTTDNRFEQQLGRNLGAFASAIKLPTK